jgi:hypothetical protein
VSDVKKMIHMSADEGRNQRERERRVEGGG